MRKLVLSLLFSCIGMYAIGQAPVQRQLIQASPGEVHDLKQLRSTPYSGWYNNLQEAGQTGFVSYTPYNNSLFPDSTVKVEYGSSNGPIVDYCSTQGVGEVFDPRKEIYSQPLSIYNSYRVDSVGLPYLYNYVKDTNAAPDTLIFQFYTYNSGGILKNTLTTKEICAYVAYNYKANLGKVQYSSQKYYLSEKDSQSKVNNIISVPTNGANGVNLKANELFAYTVSYRPGYKWNVGDTISETFSPTPKTLHSHFRFLVGQNTSKEIDMSTYEMSLTVTTGTRYNFTTYRGFPNGWNTYYVPGTAWNTNDQILWSLFYVSTPNLGIETAGELKGYGLSNVYPNPNHGSARLDFTLAKAENVSIKVYDVVGHEVATLANGVYGQGTHTINFNTDTYKSGLYFYSINAGGYSKTMKFTVTE
jgi:hypothetical protein